MASPPSQTTAPTSTTAPTTLTTIPPSSLDTLPVLTSILTRLAPPTATTSTSASTPGPTSTPSQPTPKGEASLAPSITIPLSVKEIPAATDAIKHRLQKAREMVARLPGVDVSVQEQEEEITRLEDRVRRQREVLGRLVDLGKGSDGNTVREVEMTG